MHARPAHQAQHHAHRREQGEEHSDAHRAGRALAERLERTDTGRNEHEWKNAVERPGRAASRSGRQESGEHILRATIQNLWILKASGEIGEHAKKRNRPSDERDSAGEDRSAGVARSGRTFLKKRHSVPTIRRTASVSLISTRGGPW